MVVRWKGKPHGAEEGPVPCGLRAQVGHSAQTARALCVPLGQLSDVATVGLGKPGCGLWRLKMEPMTAGALPHP